MKKHIPIYIERLRDGEIEEIEESINPQILDISDADTHFVEPVTVLARAYTADDFLLVHLTIFAKANLVCSVCNETFSYPIEIDNASFETPLDEINGAVFDLFPLIRESILLEIPFYPQCAKTSCKNRDSLDKYIKKDTPEEDESSSFRPFENL